MDIKARMKGFYPIVDTSVVEPARVPSVAESIVRAGAGILQLRAKSTGTEEFFRLATTLRNVTERAGLVFMVNDRVDVALLSRADGVHLGTEDIPPEEARRLLGRRAVIGFSTHTPEELKEADRLFRAGIVDYISFGPIFPTTTKKDARPTVGTELLKLVRPLTAAPIVAIGGITEENMEEVLCSGADAVSMISHVLTAPDVEEKVSSILGKINYRL